MKKLLRILLVLLLLLSVTVGYFYLVRPQPEDLGLNSAGTQLIVPGDVTVKWLGVSTLLIDDGETQIMTDGFFSRPSAIDLIMDRPIGPDSATISAQLQALDITRLKAITTVHSHFDHAMDTGIVAVETGAQVLGSLSTANVARGAGVPEQQITEIYYDHNYRFGKFTIRFYESNHAPINDGGPPFPGSIDSPLKPPQPGSAWKEGGSYSIVINHPRGSMLIQGSAGFIPGALNGVEVDSVFLGVGGLSTLPSAHVDQYINETVLVTQAKDVYLIHHDDFTSPFGEIKIWPTIVMDKTFVFELTQLMLPARLYYLGFNESVKVGPYVTPADE